ncbi:hypothetical protein GCM10027514_15700 [Azotobacter armeniacus]
MPVVVVDPLEMVDVEGDDREGLALQLPLLQLRLHAAAVAQPGQRVGEAFLAELAEALME